MKLTFEMKVIKSNQLRPYSSLIKNQSREETNTRVDVRQDSILLSVNELLPGYCSRCSLSVLGAVLCTRYSIILYALRALHECIAKYL